MKAIIILTLLFPAIVFAGDTTSTSWIRINQLGYTPDGIKVAVWCSKADQTISSFDLVEEGTRKIVFSGNAGKAFGKYGPFSQTARLDFSSYKKSGRYYLQSGKTRSPVFIIDAEVYKGTADFCLRYMRQQRTGFNPFLKDSCHTSDGYVLYGSKAGIPDSSYVDVVGGWHDASDYLQYSSTSANATYHLLMAYRDFPNVFGDEKLANGLDGKNGNADVLDEAKWGLDWLVKMHPREDWMFNQIADDRDHRGMRIPRLDSFYGRGHQRPVYFLSGEPQKRGKFMNKTTGTSSTAGKFASAFALGATMYGKFDLNYSRRLAEKANSAFIYGLSKQGVSQTASVVSPYIYAEENWTDDMELAGTALGNYAKSPYGASDHIGPEVHHEVAYNLARMEPVTPWLGTDTAHHYQWYPFINIGHAELARQINGAKKDTVITYYRDGINRVWQKAKTNAFYRGVPFIWCSNNLTVSFAIQCYWYEQLTNDKTFSSLEQANFDWIFGCNPWGTSMVYGLPSRGDTPVDPHSAFTHIGNYPIDGGLVDGPVYGSIYRSLIGIQLKDPDEYDIFQSDLAVYHDDYGDYSTNEPTMDGTASLIYLLAAKEAAADPAGNSSNSLNKNSGFSFVKGAITRGDSLRRKIALVFTADEFGEGASFIRNTLKAHDTKASFFFTGRFYRDNRMVAVIRQLKKDGHYLGAHSDQHLLYCDWSKRDSLLVSQEIFRNDLEANYQAMKNYGIQKKDAAWFLPPFEWYNDSIAAWTHEMGLQLVNYTPGSLSHADYTWPGMKNYRDNETIYQSIINLERSRPSGLNGFMLLLHTGTDPRRKEKFYKRLPGLLKYLKSKGYQFQTVAGLLGAD